MTHCALPPDASPGTAAVPAGAAARTAVGGNNTQDYVGEHKYDGMSEGNRLAAELQGTIFYDHCTIHHVQFGVVISECCCTTAVRIVSFCISCYERRSARAHRALLYNYAYVGPLKRYYYSAVYSKSLLGWCCCGGGLLVRVYASDISDPHS